MYKILYKTRKTLLLKNYNFNENSSLITILIYDNMSIIIKYKDEKYEKYK